LPLHIPKTKTVGDIVGAFQSITTVEYIRGVKTKEWPAFDRKLFQRNYWEHIIRDEKSYHFISNYIIENPENWEIDKLFGDV
jgi:putative transposase